MSVPDTSVEGWLWSQAQGRRAPIADLNASPDASLLCATRCLAGSCSAPGTTMGCGGCCDCLDGCYVEYEQEITAPHTWEGD